MLSPALQPAQNSSNPAPSSAGSTTGAGPDPEMQELYQEAMQRGLLTKDPEMQQLGHELRARGIVSDPTQGGLVKPAVTSPALTADPVDPHGDPALQAPSVTASPAAASPAQTAPPAPAPVAVPAVPVAAATSTPPGTTSPSSMAPAAMTSAVAAAPPPAAASPSAAAPDPIGDAMNASDKAADVYQAAPTQDNLIDYRAALQNTVNTLVLTGALSRHAEYQQWAKSLSDAGLVILPPTGSDTAASSDQAVMSEAPKLNPLEEAEQAVRTGFGHWWENLTGGLQSVRDELADPTDSSNQGLHFGQLGAGIMDMGKAAVNAVPDVAKSAYRHAIGDGDDFDVQQMDERAGNNISSIVDAPLLAAQPFGLKQATDAMGAYADGDKKGALKILKDAPGQIGEYAKANKLETALMLLPAFLHGAGMAREAFRRSEPVPATTAPKATAASEPPAQSAPAETAQAAEMPQAAGTPQTTTPQDAAPAPVRSVGGVPLGRQKPALGNPVQPVLARPAAAPQAVPETAPTQAAGTVPADPASPVDAGSSAASVPAPALAQSTEPTPAPAAATQPAPVQDAVTQDARFAENFPVDQLRLDPDRFQYKIGYGTGGSSGSLTDARAYNPDFAGVIHAWRDPADGQAYVVNGHNRVGLAQRTGTPGMDVRFLDAKDAADARTKGALINIAEGQGTALDAAKLFKETGYTPEQVQALGVNLKGQKATQGLALANLSDPLFRQTMRGEMPVERAAIIGDTLPDHGDQATLMQQIGGRSVTNDDVREMAQAIAQGPRQTSETSSLFGSEEVTRSLAVERAQAASYIKAQLIKESNAFGNASKNAGRLEKGNNTIDAVQSATLAQQNRQASDIFDAVKNAPGEVSTLLSTAARRLANAKDTGETPDAIKQDALQQFQDYAQRTYLPSREPAGSSDSAAPGESATSSGTPSSAALLDPRPGGSLPDRAGSGEVRGRQPAERGSQEPTGPGQVAAPGGALFPADALPERAAPSVPQQPVSADLVLKAPEAEQSVPAAPSVPAYSKSMDFGTGEPRPFENSPHIPEVVHEMLRRGQNAESGARSFSGKLVSDPPANTAAMQTLQQDLERSAAAGNGSISRTNEGGTIYRATEGSHELHVGLHPDGTATARVQPVAEDAGGLFADPKTADPLAEANQAPEHGDAPPTPYAGQAAIALTPEEQAAVSNNLARVAADPQAGPIAAQLHTEIQASKAWGFPKIANSAGAFGGKAVSDILEHAQDRIAAGISQVTSAAADSTFAKATRNGRYRGSYEVDKAAGDAVNQLAASGESAHTYAYYAAKHILADLNPQQSSLLVDHLLDERAKAIEAAGGTPNRADLRALTPQEVQQVQTDPKLQAALMKFENGPMGTIQQLRQFVSPRLALTKTDSGRFLSLLAKKDASGNAVNESAGSGRPTSGMSGKGTVKGTRHTQQATGTAQAYSHDLGEILQHDLTEVNQKANLKQTYKTLLAQRDAQGNPLAYSSALKAKAPLPDTITYHGKEYPAVDVKPGYRYVDKSGKIREISIRVPAPIASDLEDALTAPKRGNDISAAMQQASGLTTSLSLMSPAEITNHVGRLLSVASKLPAVGTALPQRLAEMALPYGGPRAGALYRIASTDMSDPKNVAVLQRVMDANGGSGRPFARDIGNSLASKVPGLNKVQHFTHDFLFSLPEGKGLSGFDLRLRVMAEKMRAEAEGNTDPQRVREFANQFGQYTSKPEKLIQSLRTIAPFSATSLPLKMTEMRMMVGDAGLKNLSPAQTATLRAETLFRGTAGTILGACLANHALSGHWPWQNAPGHETDLEAGKDKNGKPVYIGGNRVDPTLERPLSTLGVPDMIAGLHQPAGKTGSSKTPAINALIKDLARGGYNAAGSSLSSPMTQALTTATIGHDPLNLTRAGQMLPTAASATKANGQSQPLNNLRAAVGGLNPVLGAALGTDKQSRETQYQAPLWRTVQQLERLTGPILKADTVKLSRTGSQSKASAPLKAKLVQIGIH